MPVGLEYLKLVAFPQKPEGFDDWAKRFGDTLSPASDDFAKLMTFLQGSGATAAQFVTKFFTAKKI